MEASSNTPTPLLITVNNRLAQALQKQYDLSQAHQGLRVWPSLQVSPWNAWLQQQYETLIDTGFTDRVLMNTHQERLLWERVVRNSKEGQNLLRPAAAARTAQQTWRLIQDWQLSEEQLLPEGSAGSDETRSYLAWQQHFQKLCTSQQLISVAELGGLISNAIEHQALTIPNAIELAGFDAFSPIQQRLFEQLRTQGCVIHERELAKLAAKAQRLELNSRDDEMLAAASWAKAYIAQHPDAQIAIVSPALEKQRAALSRTLQRVLSPQLCLPNQTGQAPFNLSLGQPLAHYSLIADLLNAFKLANANDVEIAAISQLLRSPFIGGHAEEWHARAQLDFRLHEDGLPELNLTRLLKRAGEQSDTSPAYTPDLVQRLEQFAAQLSALPKEASPSLWSGHLLQLANTLGWPGEQSLDSHEYQQASKFRDVLSQLATLGRVQYNMRLSEALRWLEILCEDTVFQPQSRAEPVQVLGALEAAGLPFDAIWLIGFDDLSWPPSASPNPLLPTRLQRELGMPHASATRELEFARKLSEQLFASSAQIIVSHAKKDGEAEQGPSPLFKHIPPSTLEALGIHNDASLYTAARLDPANEPLAAPRAVPPAQSPRGGSGLLSDQAACPFRAVGKHRLRAQPLPQTQTAPDAAMLGKIVHSLLEGIWAELKDAETLRQLDDAALLKLIEPHTQAVLADFTRQRPDIYQPAFTALEVDRLNALMLRWLNLEQQRQQGFTVLKREEKEQVTLNGLSLKLQADRIDQLNDGRLVVIDYKTGKGASSKTWQDPRPTELQLPLYCINAEQPPSAALIARVAAQKLEFHGMAEDDGIAPKIKAFEGDENQPDWAALIEHWRVTLDALAAEILSGHAELAPKDKNTCTHCDLGPLCRISSLQESEPVDD